MLTDKELKGPMGAKLTQTEEHTSQQKEHGETFSQK